MPLIYLDEGRYQYHVYVLCVSPRWWFVHIFSLDIFVIWNIRKRGNLIVWEGLAQDYIAWKRKRAKHAFLKPCAKLFEESSSEPGKSLGHFFIHWSEIVTYELSILLANTRFYPQSSDVIWCCMVGFVWLVLLLLLFLFRWNQLLFENNEFWLSNVRQTKRQSGWG